jgi:hypothetical protein
MEDNILKRVLGSEKLLLLFGAWPSFHDAAVIQVVINREGPTVTISFKLNEILAQQPTISRTAIVLLQWKEVEELNFTGIDYEENNWIWSLQINNLEGKLESILVPSDGIGGRILANQIEILSVDNIKDI